MVIVRDIEKILSSDYAWELSKTTGNKKPVVALDTETTYGMVTLIADSNGNYTDSPHFMNASGLFDWLCNKRYRESNNFFFNGEYDWNAIIKWLPFNERKELIFNDYLKYEGYGLSLISKKEFKIGRLDNNGNVHNWCKYYDIAQFLSGESLAIQSVNTPQPKDTSFDIGHGVDMVRYGVDKQYRDNVRNYCIQDCKATQYLANNNVNRVYDMGIAPVAWHSKASVAKKYVLCNLKSKLITPSRRILQDSLKAVRGGYIDCLQMGVFKDVYAPDVRSCYPSIIRDMYSYNGRTSTQKEYIPDSAYSWFKVKIDYSHPFISPLWYPQVNDSLKSITQHYHVNGDMTVWICKPEYEFFNRKGYDMEILEASHILKTADTIKPFNDIITDLYNRRLEAKKDNNPIEAVIKIIMSSIYGLMLNAWYEPKFISRNDIIEVMEDYDCKDSIESYIKMYGGNYTNQNGEFGVMRDLYQSGSMYAPHIASHILAGARMKLFNDMGREMDKGYVISAATDAVTVTKLKSKLHTSNKLGNWDVKHYDEILQFGAGRYLVSQNGIIQDKLSGSRGIPLSPTKILELLKEYGNDMVAPIVKESPVKAKESFRNRYSDRDEFNEFVEKRKQIKPYTKTRHWNEVYSKIDQLFEFNIDSRPFNVCELI